MRKIDLTGKRSNRLVAIRPVRNPDGKRVWLCRCDCGKLRRLITADFSSGRIKSCGTGCINRLKYDLTGKKFGFLTALKIYEGPRLASWKGDFAWLCQCDCGKQLVKRASSLRIGQGVHCGCQQFEIFSKSHTKPNNMGLWNTVLCSVFYRMKKRGGSLDRETVISLMKKPCFYCSTPWSMSMSRGRNQIKFNGIDRKDSSEGYTIENSVPCCKTCNVMKMDMSITNFIAHIERIYDSFQTRVNGSPGSTDVILKARAKGIPVRIIKVDDGR